MNESSSWTFIIFFIARPAAAGATDYKTVKCFIFVQRRLLLPLQLNSRAYLVAQLRWVVFVDVVVVVVVVVVVFVVVVVVEEPTKA